MFVLIWSGIALLPTYRLEQEEGKADKLYARIEENTTLDRNEIIAGLRSGNLHLKIRDTFKGTDGNTVDAVIEDANSLLDLYDKIEMNEKRAIKLGLDLQGGSYLVYEVDLPKLLQNLANNKDSAFESALNETVRKVRSTNENFFDVLQQVFQEKGLRLARYFGHSRDSNAEVIASLKKEAKDAIDRTLEVLRNRIDQFGVSEPSITKQGDYRIVIELAGVQDVERAKNIIGTTALLEFQLEENPEVINSVMQKINTVLEKNKIEQMTGEQQLTESDTGAAPQTQSEQSLAATGERSLLNPGADTTGSDSLSLLNQEMQGGRPIDKYFKNVGGDIAVASKNVREVESILNSREVQAVIPKDAEFLWASKPVDFADQQYYKLYLVKKEPELTGASITDAHVQVGSQLQAGKPEVAMELNSEGAKIFAKVTGANVGKKLGIVLDGKVVSIPSIRERIPYGRASISGMADMQEANDLAIVLRAGALPAPVDVIEERTVGPSLGQDSIRKGTYSAIIGMVLVAVFMVLYYRISGFVADIALIMNLFVIMAVLAGFHATLTLPGVAGIILTIGMAVDANVLIFERIREELRSGKTIKAAIDNGYARAFKTILDANVTTLLTALVLYQFGTGPIKGFALTLSIGILASMFTAIVVTRVIFDYVTNRFAISKLSI